MLNRGGHLILCDQNMGHLKYMSGTILSTLLWSVAPHGNLTESKNILSLKRIFR